MSSLGALILIVFVAGVVAALVGVAIGVLLGSRE